MPASTEPGRRTGATLLLRIRLTPKGGRDAIDGPTTTPDGPALKARVRAAPEDGEANAALVNLVADWLGLPRRSVSLAGGHKSRTKLVAITADPSELEALLTNAINAAKGARP